MSAISPFPAPLRSSTSRRYLARLPPCPFPDPDMVSLLQRLRDAAAEGGCNVIEVTSSNHGEGVSSIVRGLARVAAARIGIRVLICDLSPAQKAVEDLRPEDDPLTLAEIAAVSGDLDRAIYWLRDTDIAICAMSNEATADRVAVETGSTQKIIAALRERFDLILLDAPPIGDGAIAVSAARLADGVVLVMVSGRTRVHSVLTARARIESVDGRIIGCVLNKRRFHIPAAIYRRL